MRKFKRSGFLKNKSFNIVSRFFLSSFIVISFFYVAPIIINFSDKNFINKEFTNNSKNILNRTLNKDELTEEKLAQRANALQILLVKFQDVRSVYECADDWCSKQVSTNGLVSYYKAYYNK